MFVTLSASLNVTVSVSPSTVALCGIGPAGAVVLPSTLALGLPEVGRPLFVRVASVPESALLMVAAGEPVRNTILVSVALTVCTHTPSASVSDAVTW